MPFFSVSDLALLYCLFKSTNVFLSALSVTFSFILDSWTASFNLLLTCSANALSLSISNFIFDSSSTVKSSLSNISCISSFDLSSPFILYLGLFNAFITMSEVLTTPLVSPIPSSKLSPKSTSWPATICPLVSPKKAPVVSIPVVALLICKDLDIGVALEVFNILLPTPRDNPILTPSKAPIVTPLPTALNLILLNNFSSFNISLTLFLEKSLPLSSSFIRSVIVKAVSIAPTKPVKPPTIVPTTGTTLPTPAPAPVATATSSDPKEVDIVA